MLPLVSILTTPVVGAVQDHHTDLAPGLPAVQGSERPSLVAFTLVPDRYTLAPDKLTALAKSSLIGLPVPNVRSKTSWVAGATPTEL